MASHQSAEAWAGYFGKAGGDDGLTIQTTHGLPRCPLVADLQNGRTNWMSLACVFHLLLRKTSGVHKPSSKTRGGGVKTYGFNHSSQCQSTN